MKAFVVAPYKSDLEVEKKRNLLLRLANEVGVNIVFASNENTDANTELSLELLESSDFVIADLSLERPSCYFEVGFAQAKNKIVFLIASAGTTIHQVKSKSKIHFYNNLDDYEKKIKEILLTNKL